MAAQIALSAREVILQLDLLQSVLLYAVMELKPNMRVVMIVAHSLEMDAHLHVKSRVDITVQEMILQYVNLSVVMIS